MSDFPSINSLLKKAPAAQPASVSDSKITEAVGENIINDSINSATGKFAKKMHEIDLKSKEKSVVAAASSLGLDYIDLTAFPISAEALHVVPENIARELKTICFFNLADEIRLGCVDYNEKIKEYAFQVGEAHHANVRIYLISENSLEKVFQLYATLPVIKPVTKDINITDEELNKFQANILDFRKLEELFKNVSISDILTLMIAASLKVNASDIHVEAEEKGIVIRYRIDGVLHDVANLPIEQWKKFVSRIKLLSALKINITDKPQDGRVTLKLNANSLDIRVSTMPTIYGESVVMRILYSGSKKVTFEDLGLRSAVREQLKREIERSSGMIISTGPTGSGKTTTMYAILRTLNQSDVKIVTLEDPVEIKMEGINQSQVDVSRDYTFAKGLRSLLRQDPDICMVGEIRDLETADIAIQSALTGHLILSTIHTNSAAGAIPRFLSMGVKPFLLAPALNAIISQRLVRKICPSCIVEDNLTEEKFTRVKEIMTALPESEKNNVDVNNLHFYTGKGCEDCSGLGYKGRIGIYEIFTMTKEIEQVILSEQVSEYAIQELLVKNGIVTILQDGLLKALDKITSVDEVFRVAG